MDTTNEFCFVFFALSVARSAAFRFRDMLRVDDLYKKLWTGFRRTMGRNDLIEVKSWRLARRQQLSMTPRSQPTPQSACGLKRGLTRHGLFLWIASADQPTTLRGHRFKLISLSLLLPKDAVPAPCHRKDKPQQTGARGGGKRGIGLLSTNHSLVDYRSF